MAPTSGTSTSSMTLSASIDNESYSDSAWVHTCPMRLSAKLMLLVHQTHYLSYSKQCSICCICCVITFSRGLTGAASTLMHALTPDCSRSRCKNTSQLILPPFTCSLLLWREGHPCGWCTHLVCSVWYKVGVVEDERLLVLLIRLFGSAAGTGMTVSCNTKMLACLE